MKTNHHDDVSELRRETAHDAAPSPGSSRRRHLPELDGIRGLAVLLVFLVHYGGGAKSSNPVIHFVGVAIQAGWCGVTLFFILSGFLISGIIWDSRLTQGWWGKFYMRRTLRIFPLYYASLLVVLLAAAWVGNGRFALTHIWVYALYLQNLPIHVSSGNLGSPLVLSHFWSLAVEEQFYLLWPLLLTRARTLRQAKYLSLAIFFGSAAFRIAAWYLLPAPPDASGVHRIFHGAYGFTLCRAGELAAGAFLAMCYRDPETWKQIRRFAAPGLFAGLAGFLIAAHSAHTLTDECQAGFLYGLPSMTVCLAALLVLSLDHGIVNRFARISWLRFMGAISYGFYIFHVLFTPVFDWITLHFVPSGSRNLALGAEFLIAGALSTTLAYLSFRFFESHFLRQRSRYQVHAAA